MKIRKIAYYDEIIYIEEQDNGMFYLYSYSGGQKVELGLYNKDNINDAVASYKRKGYNVKLRQLQPETMVAFNNIKIRKQSQAQAPDFTSVDVRRMSGIFSDFQGLSRNALEEMDKWLANGEYNITIEEAEKRLSYYLNRMGIK